MKGRLKWIAPLALLLAAMLGGTLYPDIGAGSARAYVTPDAALPASDAGWTVGELRPDGLRLIPSGRSDAAAVLNPARFADSSVRHAYWVATQIPEVLNQLYCWCGCENRGVHRSNLQCFEDQMAVNCDVCQGTAEIAYGLVQQGITDAGTIQAAVECRVGAGDMSARDLDDREMHSASAPAPRLLHRVRRLQGQLAGIERMLGERRSFDDVLDQVASVRQAVNGLAAEVLVAHIAGRGGRPGAESARAGDEVRTAVRRVLRHA